MDALWAELEAERPAGRGIVRRRLRADSGRDIFVGVSHPDLRRMLILSVDAWTGSAISTMPVTAALSTSMETGQSPGKSELHVTLTVREMARVFTPFVDDVVDAMARAGTDDDAVTAFLTRFEHWRRLLAGTDPDGLSHEEAQGLYGELWVLRHLLLEPLGGSAAVGAWTGPGREDRDFLWRDVGLEVKTTIGDNPPTVLIRSERQLQTDVAGLLFLVAMTLDAAPGGRGQTLNELVDEVLGRMPSDQTRLECRDKLLEYGYLDAHRPQYEQTRYVIREASVFRVGEGFPRLTEHDLPNGVGEVRYKLALTACAAWRAEVDSVKAAFTTGP
jgi:hypothetical protein